MNLQFLKGFKYLIVIKVLNEKLENKGNGDDFKYKRDGK